MRPTESEGGLYVCTSAAPCSWKQARALDGLDAALAQIKSREESPSAQVYEYTGMVRASLDRAAADGKRAENRTAGQRAP